MKSDNNKVIIIVLCAALLLSFFMPWIKIFISLSAWDMVFGTAGDMINSPIRYVVAIIPVASILIIYSAIQNKHPSSKSFIYCVPLIVLIIIGILICYKIGGDNVKNFNSEILRVFGIGFWLTLISSLILAIFGISAPIKNLNTVYISPEADDKNSPNTNPADGLSMSLQQYKSEIVIDNNESINFNDLYKKGVDWYIRNRKIALITISSCTMVLILLIVLGSTIWSTRHKIEKYIDAGQYEQAKGLLFTEIQKSPNDEDWQYLLGECYLASGDVPNASESFNRAIRLNLDIQFIFAYEPIFKPIFVVVLNS